MNNVMEKLKFDGECFTWDGDQVAFVDGGNTVCLCMSEEDFVNNEIDEQKRAEIRTNQDAIINAIKAKGFCPEED
jgi:hypothetical protein